MIAAALIKGAADGVEENPELIKKAAIPELLTLMMDITDRIMELSESPEEEEVAIMETHIRTKA